MTMYKRVGKIVLSGVVLFFALAIQSCGKPAEKKEESLSQPPMEQAAYTLPDDVKEKMRQAGAKPDDIALFDDTLDKAAPESREMMEARLRNATDEENAKTIEDLRTIHREQGKHPTLGIGDAMPDFRLKGVDGKVYSAADFKDDQLLVFMFMSNHCPFSQAYEERKKKLYEDFAKKGVGFIAIQPDNAEAVAPSELGYTDVDDSFEGMVVRQAFAQYPFPYLYDGDEQDTTHQFGPKATPHIFIFDKDRKLRYEGRVDDNLREEKASSMDARNAIEALLAGKPVPVEHTPVFGCTIKWKSRIEGLQKEQQAWREKPVTVETVSLEGLKELRNTAPGKTLIINFWATWCGPCRVEFPELLKTYQWYRGRGVDFVSVSVDIPEARAEVINFLKDVHSPVRNLQVDTDDFYAIQAAFDSSWESGVPFTLVLAPDGKVVYRHEGELDVLQMRRSILASLGANGGSYPGQSTYWNR